MRVKVRILERDRGTVRGRDRWHRAWPAIDGTVRGPARDSGLFDDLHGKIDINGAGGRVTVVGCPGSAVSGVRVSVRCPSVARDRWHRAWPARDLNAKTISKRCAIDGTVRGPRSMAPCVATRSMAPCAERFNQTISNCAIDGTVRGPRSMAPCVARDRWHRAWPAIDGTVRGPRSMAPCVARDRWHRAWPAIDGTVRGPRSMAPCVARDRWHRAWPAIDDDDVDR